MGKRRVTLFIEFSGEPNDDKLLAERVGEALVARLGSAGVNLKWPSGQGFTPGPGTVETIKIAVGTTKLEQIEFIDHAYRLSKKSVVCKTYEYG